MPARRLLLLLLLTLLLPGPRVSDRASWGGGTSRGPPRSELGAQRLRLEAPAGRRRRRRAGSERLRAAGVAAAAGPAEAHAVRRASGPARLSRAAPLGPALRATSCRPGVTAGSPRPPAGPSP